MSRFDTMSWPEVKARSESGEILLVPLGSTEQHGPHLPVTTDTDIATAVAVGAAARDGGLVVAPALPYGSSGEHQGFAGTVSIGQEATELALVELGRSASIAFGHVIVVSAHGGNAAPVARATERLAGEGRSVTAWTPKWEGDLHAGRTETSLMLAIAPTRVRLEDAEAGDTRPLAELYPLVRRDGVLAVTPNGVLGDPAGAGAEEGRRLLESAIADLLGLAERLRAVPTMEVTR
jgi:mycofactocin system creatininase family protein